MVGTWLFHHRVGAEEIANRADITAAVNDIGIVVFSSEKVFVAEKYFIVKIRIIFHSARTSFPNPTMVADLFVESYLFRKNTFNQVSRILLFNLLSISSR